MKISLRTPLNPNTGYGQTGIGLTRALVNAGHEIHLDPLHVAPPLPRDVADLLQAEPPTKFDALLHLVPPVKLGLCEADLDRAPLRIGWTMWEYPGFQSGLAEEVASRTTGYTKILAYDVVTKNAYEALDDLAAPVSVLQGGCDVADWWDEDEPVRDWHSDTFIFAMAGDLSARKNPVVAMRAVQRLKDEGFKVELRLKTRHHNSIPDALINMFDCLKVYSGVWPQALMKEFYLGAHCYVAPSWGEGLNLPAIESGVTGCALVLSDVGGHRGWGREEFAQFVGGQTNAYQSPETFLEVDVEELYLALRRLVEDRAMAREMGRTARLILPAAVSWESVVQRLEDAHLRG